MAIEYQYPNSILHDFRGRNETEVNYDASIILQNGSLFSINCSQTKTTWQYQTVYETGKSNCSEIIWLLEGGRISSKKKCRSQLRKIEVPSSSLNIQVRMKQTVINVQSLMDAKR